MRVDANVPVGGRTSSKHWGCQAVLDSCRWPVAPAARHGGARRGHPLLDLARTHTMLTVEPGLATLPVAARAALRQFVEAWADGYGPEARAIPSACLRWAGVVMLADLGPRYAADPTRLESLRRWTDS